MEALGSWYAVADMLAPQAADQVAAVDGVIFVTGSFANGSAESIVEAYDPAADTWIMKSPMPSGRAFASAIGYQGKLYVLPSGIYGTLGSSLFIYDPTTDTWATEATPLNSWSGDGGVINGQFYVTAPYSQATGYSNDFWRYDPATHVWTRLASAPRPHAFAAVGVIKNKLYVAGGEYSAGELDIYDPATNTWSAGTSMPVPLQHMAGAVVGDRLFSLGGEDSGNNDHNTSSDAVYVYDPSCNSWSADRSMPHGRQQFTAASVNGTIYAPGGLGQEFQYLTAVDAFLPAASTACYPFAGFLQPVDNLPTVNGAKAGSAIPIKFGLGSDEGLDIFAPGYPASAKQACDGSSVDPIEQTVTANVSGLTYDQATGRYTYVWKTDPAWKNSCRRFVLGLKDGSVHTASFQFK